MTDKNKTMCHEVCTGCSCCLLPCPVWRRTKDRSLTAQGRNKALQSGAGIEDIAPAIDACLLCGTCEQSCPEANDIVGLTIEHRRQLNQIRKDYPSWYPKRSMRKSDNADRAYKGSVLLAGGALSKNPALRKEVANLLNSRAVVADDDGSDILSSLEAGLAISAERIAGFIRPLKDAKQLIVAEGGLHRHLQKWLPDKRIIGLGPALLAVGSIRGSLNAQDLYVIESCGYHSDYARLVGFYDKLRQETGAQLNLDLQRLAVPTGASSLQAIEDMESAGCVEQVRWILHGRKVARVIVESAADIAAFEKATDAPVVHLAQLACR